MSRKEEYNKLLTSWKWKKKRAKILERDEFKCTKCGEINNLHVHHIWYIDGNKPWQVPNEYLTTLCSLCHEKEHEGRPIYTFIKYTKKKSSGGEFPKTGNKKAKRKKPVPYKITWKLTRRDKKLQKRYDALKK